MIGDDEVDIEQIRKAFDLDGFVIIREFLSADEVAELGAKADRYMREVLTGKAHKGTLKNLNKDDLWFQEQLEHGKQVKLIETLLGDQLEPATTAWFDRIPGETKGIEPHFDAIGHRRLGATIWIALETADLTNGCLYYVKGSHKKKFPSKVGLEGFSPDADGVAAQMNPGDAAIHSSLTVHWSEPNRSERARPAISYFYWAASSKGDPDAKSWFKKTAAARHLKIQDRN